MIERIKSHLLVFIMVFFAVAALILLSFASAGLAIVIAELLR